VHRLASDEREEVAVEAFLLGDEQSVPCVVNREPAPRNPLRCLSPAQIEGRELVAGAVDHERRRWPVEAEVSQQPGQQGGVRLGPPRQRLAARAGK
jgi:hypothetical protein